MKKLKVGDIITGEEMLEGLKERIFLNEQINAKFRRTVPVTVINISEQESVNILRNLIGKTIKMSEFKENK